MVTHAYTASTELDVEAAHRRSVPLTPGHAASFNLMWEGQAWGPGSAYVLVGALFERRIGAWRAFVNAENLGNVRQTRFDPLVRPERLPDGRWTVDAWAPLDGRVVNGGLRVGF